MTQPRSGAAPSKHQAARTFNRKLSADLRKLRQLKRKNLAPGRLDQYPALSEAMAAALAHAKRYPSNKEITAFNFRGRRFKYHYSTLGRLVLTTITGEPIAVTGFGGVNG